MSFHSTFCAGGTRVGISGPVCARGKIRRCNHHASRFPKTHPPVQESFNASIQALKANARGFRRFQHYRTRILFFLGKLLRAWRKARGLNQLAAAQALGVGRDQAKISKRERGKGLPVKPVLVRLMETLAE